MSDDGHIDRLNMTRMFRDGEGGHREPKRVFNTYWNYWITGQCDQLGMLVTEGFDCITASFNFTHILDGWEERLENSTPSDIHEIFDDFLSYGKRKVTPYIQEGLQYLNNTILGGGGENPLISACRKASNIFTPSTSPSIRTLLSSIDGSAAIAVYRFIEDEGGLNEIWDTHKKYIHMTQKEFMASAVPPQIRDHPASENAAHRLRAFVSLIEYKIDETGVEIEETVNRIYMHIRSILDGLKIDVPRIAGRAEEVLGGLRNRAVESIQHGRDALDAWIEEEGGEAGVLADRVRDMPGSEAVQHFERAYDHAVDISRSYTSGLKGILWDMIDAINDDLKRECNSLSPDIRKECVLCNDNMRDQTIKFLEKENNKVSPAVLSVFHVSGEKLNDMTSFIAHPPTEYDIQRLSIKLKTTGYIYVGVTTVIACITLMGCVVYLTVKHMKDKERHRTARDEYPPLIL
eukprot:GHVO01005144.1.p1 GENE.GHVO01005144.1~~GHVO01005144.1.p1  ORF type:complete len:461 (+),score=99.64 GHVO01005144.1:93-1475(+)